MVRKSAVDDAIDANDRIAGLLRDLASVQKSTQSRWGYKRAAASIRNLDQPVQNFLEPDGSLRKIPNIGPASTRVILEVLRTGASDIVAKAVAESGRASEVERSRQLRAHFLTRARVVAALSDANLGGPGLEGYRGDLQMHSTWSDGSQTLDDIATAGIERGYEYCAVTDHSYGLPIAGGVSMDDLGRQHAEIDRLNRRHRGRFTLLKGIEANIRADGTVDMSADELRRLQIVVAAPHSALRSPHDQTARMIAAVSTPGVNILGHPRGRCTGRVPASPPLGRASSPPPGKAGWRLKSTATLRARTSITTWPGPLSWPAVCSRSTATPTVPASWPTPKRHSPMRASHTFQSTAS